MPFWPNLTSFRANDNLFTGTLPFLGVSPRKFRNLDLFNNSRISGTIPSYLSGLYGLTRLDLSNLTLHGPFPASLLSDNKFKSLQYLSLHSNALTGSLPGDLPPQPVLPILRYLYMQNNDLSGTLPLNIGYAYPQLSSVLLSGKRLSSTIPPSLFDIPNLLAVDLSHNSLSGSIALNGTAGNIINLYLSWNSLTGSIPPSICPSLPEIETIDVSHNLLSGSPPFCLAKAFKKLHSLSLAANRLTSSSLDFLPQTGNVNLVDISTNSFQGVLPSAFFSVNANKLQTFAAASNCLQGSIPPSLCLASRLQTLVLDGLNGGRACRVLVATSDGNSNAFKFTGTKTRTQMQGELPSCLFTLLPNISTLHVSGNGLSGNIFSSLARWPASLKDLSASHNRLSGTIPAHLQQTMGQFRVFDLANNKLGGLLDQVANLSSADAQISLKVNRFSGQLSSAIISAPAPIAVLEGNLFGCTSRSQLPDGDAFKPRFECGSDSFNGVLIAFVVVLLTAAVSVFSAHKLHHLLLPAMPAHIALAKMLSSLWALRLFLLVATAVFALVLLPVYGAVSATHGTHIFSYAWTVSAVFIGGEAAAGVFLFFWLPLLVAAYYWLISQQQEHRKNSSKEEKEKLKTSLSSTFLSFDGKVHDRRLTLLASRLLTFAVNAAFVLPPNIGYVWVVRMQSDKIKTVTSLALTVYKQLWGRTALPFLLKRGGHMFGLSVTGFLFELLLVAFNLILAPALALLTTDSNCLLEALYAPPPVTSSYNTTVVVTLPSYPLYTLGGNLVPGSLSPKSSISTTPVRMSYVPTFQYGYQCSASLLQAYGPVFLLMALFSCLGEPMLFALLFLKTLLWHHVLTHCSGGSSQAAEDFEADCAEFVSQPNPLFAARWFLVGFSSCFLFFFLVDAAGDAVGWKRAMWAPALMWTLPTLLALALGRFSSARAPSSQPKEAAATVELPHSLGKHASVSRGDKEEDQRFTMSEMLERESVGHADRISASLQVTGTVSPLHDSNPQPSGRLPV